MGTAIFISYRRSDTQGWAGHLRDSLSRSFGHEVLFFDMTSIPPGRDFVRAIEGAVASASVVVVLIGPHWLSADLPDGRRRLDNPGDFVRLEVAAALRQQVTVIPLLVGGASMPRGDDLPEDLAALARRQALEMTDARWDYDLSRLCDAIEEASGLARLAPGGGGEPEREGAVSVGAGLTLENVDAADVVGIKLADPGAAPPLNRAVDVMKGATVKHAKLGDIAGIKIGGGRTGTQS